MSTFGIRAPDGSATTPQFSFASDTNSGFYRIGGDNVGLTLGGTKRWDFATAGSTLTGTLTVSGAVTLQSTLGVTGTLTASGALVASTTLAVTGLATFDTYIQGTTGDGFLDLRGDSGATLGVRIADTGVVGISTTDLETWNTAYTAVQIGSTSAVEAGLSGAGEDSISLLNNIYRDSGGLKHKTTGAAARLLVVDGRLDILVSASASADAGIADTQAVRVGNDGAVAFAAIGTTGSAANAFLDSGAANNLLRSTSSLRYKADLRDIGAEEARSFVLGLRPVAYRSLAPADNDREFVGFGAEHVAPLDPRFIHYRDGEPDGVMYDRLTAPFAALLKDHEARLAMLEAA